MNSNVLASQPRTFIEDPQRGRLETWPLPAEEAFLYDLLKRLFEQHWQDITFGPLIPGAAWEMRTAQAPTRVNLNNGYLTVDFGLWHFHLCIGTFNGVAPELALQRRTAQVELYRRVNKEDQPLSWGLCLHNHAGHQQMTVLLPNPFLTPDQKVSKTPDWSRLALWDQLRHDYLGLAPDPVDRSGTGFGGG